MPKRPSAPARAEAERLAAADQWFAVFCLIRAARPNEDVMAIVAATDWAMKT